MSDAGRGRQQDNDLTLAPGEYAYISDQASGKIRIVVGPKKDTVSGTEQAMKYIPVPGASLLEGSHFKPEK